MKSKLLVILTVAFVTAMTFCLMGCAPQEEKSTDEQFMTALAKGLEDRWAITDAEEASQESIEKAIQKEKDAVSEFYEAEFENAELGDCAKRYIDALNASNAADMFSTSGYSRWSQVYNQRVAALYDINAITEIPVSEKGKSNLEGLLNDGQAASFAIASMNSLAFEAQAPEYEGDTFLTYKAVAENTSTVTFSYISYNINLLDADGVVLESTTVFSNDWAPGAKHAFEFMTNTAFASYEVTSCDWAL